MQAQLGRIVAKLNPKTLSRWLVEKYDLWDISLNLLNGKWLIYEKDVHAKLGLIIGRVEVNEVKN